MGGGLNQLCGDSQPCHCATLYSALALDREGVRARLHVRMALGSVIIASSFHTPGLGPAAHDRLYFVQMTNIVTLSCNGELCIVSMANGAETH